MEALKENKAVDQVAERLALKFPDVDPGHVASLVRQIAAQFTDATVRDYVPILIEHSASNRLRQQLLGDPAA